MLISNQPLFDLDQSTTAAILQGNLDPATHYDSEPLRSAAVGSLYASVTYNQSPTGPVNVDASLWQKVRQSGVSNCDCPQHQGPASAGDWVPYRKGEIICRDTAPIPIYEPWINAPAGTVHLQKTSQKDCDCNPIYKVYVKTCDGCTDNAWVLISPVGKNILVSHMLPWNNPATEDSVVGDVYYHICAESSSMVAICNDEATQALVRYEKVGCSGSASDWKNTDDEVHVKLATFDTDDDGNPILDCTKSEIECLPIGAKVYVGDSCDYWERKARGSEDCQDDWCLYQSHPPMTVTQGDEFSFDAEAQDLVIPNAPDPIDPCSVISFTVTNDRECNEVTASVVRTDTPADEDNPASCSFELRLPYDLFAVARTQETAVALPDDAWTNLPVPTDQFETVPPGATFFGPDGLCLVIPACTEFARVYEIEALVDIVVDPAQVDLNDAMGGLAITVDGVQWYKEVQHFDNLGELFTSISIDAVFAPGTEICVQAFARNTNGTASATIGDIHIHEVRGWN